MTASTVVASAKNFLNGDGNPNIVLVAAVNEQPHPPIRVLWGNGDGSFQAPLCYDAAAFNPYQAVIADVNADGKPDLVVADEFLVS